MTPSQQFLRFAADCQSMAMFKCDPKSKLVWRQLAERWTRCARWAERESLAAQNARLQRQRRQCEKERPPALHGDEGYRE
jgi:hypothetical protein